MTFTWKEEVASFEASESDCFLGFDCAAQNLSSSTVDAGWNIQCQDRSWALVDDVNNSFVVARQLSGKAGSKEAVDEKVAFFAEACQAFLVAVLLIGYDGYVP